MNLELPKGEEKDSDIETAPKAESEDNGQWRVEKAMGLPLIQENRMLKIIQKE